MILVYICIILTLLAYIANDQIQWFILQQINGRKRATLSGIVRRHFDTLLSSVFISTTLDGATSFFSRFSRVNNVLGKLHPAVTLNMSVGMWGCPLSQLPPHLQGNEAATTWVAEQGSNHLQTDGLVF